MGGWVGGGWVGGFSTCVCEGADEFGGGTSDVVAVAKSPKPSSSPGIDVPGLGEDGGVLASATDLDSGWVGGWVGGGGGGGWIVLWAFGRWVGGLIHPFLFSSPG